MDKAKLIEAIAQKERQLVLAENEATAWNRGKYKHTEKAKLSKILAESLQKELRKLQSQLSEYE